MRWPGRSRGSAPGKSAPSAAPTAAPSPTPQPPDAGVSAVEVVLLTPLVLFMVMLVVSLGVLVDMHGQVNAAARDAARAGSMQADGGQALTQATAEAQADLGDKCQAGGDLVKGDYQPPAGPGGVGYYRTTVTCVIDMTGFGVFGAKQTITATFAAPVDPNQNSDLAGP